MNSYFYWIPGFFDASDFNGLYFAGFTREKLVLKCLFLNMIAMILLIGCKSEADNVIILHDINGYTIQDNEWLQFEAIAIGGGKVLALGTFTELNLRYPAAEQISGDGATLLPGLIDAHAHVMGLGFQEIDVDLAGIQSLEETVEKIAGHVSENPELEWVTGRGWNQVLWDGNEFPTAEDIDEVVSDKPVWLTRVDGHAGWANSKAMELAGITNETPDPQGGRIIRDEEGRATGIFVDTAMRYVRDEIPDRTPEERERALELAMDKIASYGITSVHDARIDVDDWRLYKKFAGDRRLLTRIYAMIGGTGDIFDELASGGPIESYAEDMLALRSVKISADGALGSRGAALLEEYDDEPGHSGLLFFDQVELNSMVYKGASSGFQMNIHAIGDAANRQVLNAFEYVRNELGDQGLRHRVEHAQVVHPGDIPRFAELNLIASVQPTHATSDMNMAEDRVGTERIKGAYAWQTFLNQGTLIAAGSDFPVERVNPFYGLYSGITRQDFDGNPPGGWYPEHALSRGEVLRAFTINAAYAAHQEDVIGSLEPGKWADFILVDQDFFKIDESRIWQIEVLETWLAGERVYKFQE